MEIGTVISAISTVGFPIAAAAALFWLVWKMQQMHKEEMDKVRDALNNNTLALTELSLKLNTGGLIYDPSTARENGHA